MKRKSMKSINIFLSVAAIFLLAFITGCTGFSNSKSSEKYVQKYVLKGRVSSSVRKSSPTSKNATVSINLDEVQFEITAKKFDEATQTFEEAVYEPEDYESGTAFSFTFNKTGRYKITVKAKQSGKVFAQGSEFVTIEDEDTEPVIIKLSLQGEGTAVGNVHLPVYLSNDIETVTSLEVRWEEARDFDATYPFEDGVATIDVEDIDSGTHHIKLNFLDNKGNALYSCSEMVMVYTGCTTNVWYGTAPYLNSTGKFTLTNSLISAHHANILPNTKTLLFEYDCSDSLYSYNYYLVDDNNMENISGSVINGIKKVSYATEVKDFTAFDKDGNIYICQPNTLYNGGTLISNKDGWQAPDLANLSIDEYAKGFTIDLVTNIAYCVRGAEGSCEFYQYPDLISSNGTTTDRESYSGSISVENSVFTVYDNRLYILTQLGDYNTYHLYIYNVTSGGEFEFAMMIPVDPREMFNMDEETYLPGEFTDITCQDDCLYMLYNESPDNHSYRGYSGHWESSDKTVRSRGAVIRYNLITGDFESLGFSENKIAHDSFKLRALTFGSGDPMYDTTDNTKFLEIPASGKELYPDIYCPAESEKAFYGARKFIAVKPKKLVISDEGLCFYTGDDGVLRYKNKNRIVYVDLEDFAIKEFKTPGGNVSMSEDITYALRGWVTLEYPEVIEYRLETSPDPQSNDCYYVGILNGDSGD